MTPPRDPDNLLHQHVIITATGQTGTATARHNAPIPTYKVHHTTGVIAWYPRTDLKPLNDPDRARA